MLGAPSSVILYILPRKWREGRGRELRDRETNSVSTTVTKGTWKATSQV